MAKKKKQERKGTYPKGGGKNQFVCSKQNKPFKKGPCTDNKPEHWKPGTGLALPSVGLCLSVVVFTRKTQEIRNLGIMKSAWAYYPSSKAVDDYLGGFFNSAVSMVWTGAAKNVDMTRSCGGQGCWPGA